MNEHLKYFLIRFRVRANSCLSKSEPLVLLLAPLFTLLVAVILHRSIRFVIDNGLRNITIKLFTRTIKLVPGCKRYLDSEKQKAVDKLQSRFVSQREGWRMVLPMEGLGIGVIEKMEEEKAADVTWQGKCSGTVYIGGSESQGHFFVINEACAMFAHTNPLHLDVFRSIARFEAEVVAMTAALLGSADKDFGREICGNMTSGGTESILLAVKSSRDYMCVKRGIMRPEMIIPESAHAAYNKAAQYFNVKLWRIPVNNKFEADVKEIGRHVNRNTIMIVGSAPGYPHGIIDPIEALGELAMLHGICFHVDLCLGGFVLPFAREIGHVIPPFDFSVQGVTSISVDVHKYGLAPKGTSVVLYKNHDIRKHQFVAVTEWSGGLYVSPTIAGSRPGCLIAGAWAAMMSVGHKGYLHNTEVLMEVSKKIRKGIEKMADLFVIGKPQVTIVAFGSNTVDIFEVNDIMSLKGWHLNPLQRPNSIHICVTLQHVTVCEEFLSDLQDSIQTVKESHGPIGGGLAPLYGAASKMPNKDLVKELLIEFMDSTC